MLIKEYIIKGVRDADQYIPIDLSADNIALIGWDIDDPMIFEQYITQYLRKHGATVAYGGYLERRAIYRRSKHFTDSAAPVRDIHLGVDLWCPAGTGICAPLDGYVHSFQVNNNFGDYGPTIILRHQINGETFHTLYGHLSTSSLDRLAIGQKIAQGQLFCHLGDHTENGSYAPHLHLQVIKDMEGHHGDYPGVCSEDMLEHYRNNCPDPLSII